MSEQLPPPTPAEIEDCKRIIKRWIAAGRIKVRPALSDAMIESVWKYTPAARDRVLTGAALSRKARRFSP